jgi:AcrR family transcriptional regulator
MPKKPDAHLEARILKAAFNLWLDGGEQALTMRTVARAAKTTTPTLYQRFRDKNALLAALRARAQQDLYDAVEPSRSIADAFRIAIDFTVTRGHEYELIGKDWAARLSRKEPTPSFDLVKQRLAEQLGGSPADHTQLALGIVALYHGASMLLLGADLDPAVASAIKEACIAATDTLVNSAGAARG